MIYGKKNILAWFESTKFPYWTIYHQGNTTSGNFVAKSDESETATAAAALEDLTHRIGWLNGKYTIVASGVPKNVSKGTFREDFSISMSEENQTTQQLAPVQQISGIAPDEMEKRIAAAVDAAMTKKELADLKVLVKEQEKEIKTLTDNGPMATIAGLAKEYAPVVIPHLFPAAGATAKVAGLPADEQEDDNQDQARLVNIVNIMESIDPDWLVKLEKLAFKLQANPSMWGMVQTFI